MRDRTIYSADQEKVIECSDRVCDVLENYDSEVAYSALVQIIRAIESRTGIKAIHEDGDA